MDITKEQKRLKEKGEELRKEKEQIEKQSDKRKVILAVMEGIFIVLLLIALVQLLVKNISVGYDNVILWEYVRDSKITILGFSVLILLHTCNIFLEWKWLKNMTKVENLYEEKKQQLQAEVQGYIERQSLSKYKVLILKVGDFEEDQVTLEMAVYLNEKTVFWDTRRVKLIEDKDREDNANILEAFYLENSIVEGYERGFHNGTVTVSDIAEILSKKEIQSYDYNGTI